MKSSLKFLLLTIVLLYAVNNLSAQSNGYFELSLPEVEITNEEFKQLIVRSTGHFVQNYKQLPGVVVISIYGDHSKLKILIRNIAYLYLDDEERKWWSETQKFKYATKINNIPVLFDLNLKNSEEERLLKANGLIKKHIIKYGTLIAQCSKFYDYNSKFIPTDQYCTSDLYLD